MMNTTHRPAKIVHLWDSIFVPGSQVNTKLHLLEIKAAAAGCTTLAEYHASRRANS